jgi:ParB family transcriptional regulator, chromosome partitioning protein
MVDTSSSTAALSIQQIPLNRIYTSPHQMRRHFDLAGLKELAASMKQEGLIQPITLRKVGEAFELIVGERRLRAARILKWETIDARIIDISDEDAAVKGLIENLQRADLSPIEEARGYKQLVDAPYNLTQEAIAQRVGKSQTVIARALALLELPEEIQALMPRGIITETHTRSLRKVPERSKQVALARQAHREGWTTKELERRVAELLTLLGMPTLQRATRGGKAEPDPLEKIWKEVLRSADKVGVKMTSVQYRKNGKWLLEIVSKASNNPRRVLADFFIRLGHTLNAATPLQK